jgi:D-serine deaminase-like pyridoxal phosphate-dependent protein
MLDQYERYRELIRNERLPVALVDLDAVDHNIEVLLADVRWHGKTLRLASKSIRCLWLLKYITERGQGAIRGILSYSVAEAAFLVEHGFTDIIVAYPTVQPSDCQLLAQLNDPNRRIAIVVDSEAHLEALRGTPERPIPVVIEVDLSYRPLGGRVHLGARRSPLRSPEAVVHLAQKIAQRRDLKFLGLMGYEAQIAGVGESNPFSPLLNPARKLIKKLSRPYVAQMRQRVLDLLRQHGFAVEIFNGGGTGSVAFASAERALTEVTAGSGFLCSHLFDYYGHLKLKPAIFFALQIVRIPDPGFVTCHGGGLIASGPAGADRLPVPYLPPGLKLTALEGAGEVQTPLRVPKDVTLRPGDPVFFRHAKAGELAEHFNEYLIVRGKQIVTKAPTYRGMGKCFLG